MHRLGQQIRREILRPQSLDYAHGTDGLEGEASHLTALRERLESLEGREIVEKVERLGTEGVLREWGATVEEVRALEMERRGEARGSC